jgi:hypothetical protein
MGDLESLVALVLVAVMAVSAGCSPAPSGPVPESTADAICAGDDIVTVNDSQPTAKAVAVKGGRILAVGTREAVEKAHANLLAAPDGDANTVDDIVRKLKVLASGPDVKRTGWIFGMGYNDSLLGRHPTRDDLDKVSTKVPVIAVHISGHFSAVNSVALKQIGYTAATKDPVGGVIRRRPGSREPLGVNEELAHFAYAFGAVADFAIVDRNPIAGDLTTTNTIRVMETIKEGKAVCVRR